MNLHLQPILLLKGGEKLNWTQLSGYKWAFHIRTESELNVSVQWMETPPAPTSSSRASLRIPTLTFIFVNIFLFACIGVMFMQQLFTLSVKNVDNIYTESK